MQRIIDVINADTELIEKNNPDKLREVLFGDPENNDYTTISTPFVYITTRSNSQKTSYATGMQIANSKNQVTVEYDIVLVSQANSKTAVAQSLLYELLTKLDNLAQGNPLFLKPVSNDDPIFTRSVINGITWDDATRGILKNKMTLVLTATIGSNLTVDFPGIGDIFMLSQKGGSDGLRWGEDFMGDAERVLTDGGDFGSIMVEYESSYALDDLFRAKYGVVEDIEFKRGHTSKTFKCKYLDLTPTIDWDVIPRTILHLEITK